MGEKQEENLYYKSGEEWVKIGALTQVPEFHPTYDHGSAIPQGYDCSSAVINAWDEVEIAGYLKPSKIARCKTRKRFIKLLMSIGFQRDRAVAFAEDTRECMPYSAAWWWIRLMGGTMMAMENEKWRKMLI